MTFTDIYRMNAWAGRESLSGPGSGSAATLHVREHLLDVVRLLDARSVLDVGCGDGFWMPDVPGYLGIDVARPAIVAARRRHPNREYRQAVVSLLDSFGFDLVVCRDVIQHLSYGNGLALIRGIRRTGSRWLLASTFVGGVNRDIQTGDAYSPDLTAAPFNLGEPASLLFDGYGYDDPDAIRDPRKFLGLWAL